MHFLMTQTNESSTVSEPSVFEPLRFYVAITIDKVNFQPYIFAFIFN